MQNEALKTNDKPDKQKTFGECSVLYIIEAMLEYFVALSVANTYLAKITDAVGLSDGATGIISAFVSLGCGFQVLSIVLFRSSRVKKPVTIGHFISQALFTSAYLLPLASFSGELKCVLLVLALLAAQITHNLVVAPKMNWYMSMIRDEKRGIFTAIKEIVSLFGGIIFSYALAYAFDYFDGAGNKTAAFVCGAIILALITLSHTLVLLLTKKNETPPSLNEGEQKEPFIKTVKILLSDKRMWKIILIFSLWTIANYAVASFMGTYCNKELGFPLTLTTTITSVCNVIRAAVSVPLGKFADKKGFNKLLAMCFAIGSLGFGVYAFTTASNGKILYPIFYMCYTIVGMGASTSSINIIYDYIPAEHCTHAFALNQSVAGVTGFLITTLVLTPILNAVQANGNVIFGATIYAQQIFAALSCVITAGLAVYTLKGLGKRKKIC